MIFTLNGEKTEYQGPLNARLLDVLRDEYRLTGVKCGCKEGECGSCSVLLDGILVNSCMVAMGRAAGSDVALETADVALMSDDLSQLPFAVGLSR